MHHDDNDYVKVEVKAAALHAVASVLGSPNTSSMASSSTTATLAAAAAGNDEDGDQVMGNTAAAEAAKERSTLCLMLFTRLAESNTNQRAGGWLLDLARQPVPEVNHWRPVLFLGVSSTIASRGGSCRTVESLGWKRGGGGEP